MLGIMTGLTTPSLAVNLAEVERALKLVDPIFLHTPQFESQPLSERYGCRVIVKVETVNPIGSFKGRGGDWLAQTADLGRPLVCASAGNLGQGLAYGARRAGLELHVFASRAANALKLERMRSLGATLHLVDGDFDLAKTTASQQAESRGWRLVVDGEDPRLAEGAATMAAELTGALGEEIDTIFLPVGNGSLACGAAVWFKQKSPKTRVVGVSSLVAPATHDTWKSGQITVGPPFSTIAEGLCARVPVPSAVACLRDTLDDFVLLDESLFLDAMADLWSAHRIVAEPSGVAPLAAAAASEDLEDKLIVVPVGGANTDLEMLRKAVERDRA